MTDHIERMQAMLRRTQNRSYLIAAAILVSVLLGVVDIWLSSWWLAALAAVAIIVNVVSFIKNHRLEGDIEHEIENAIITKWKLPR